MRRLLVLAAFGLALMHVSPGSAQPNRSLVVPAGVMTSSRTSTPVVALTFDDGPSAYTSQILGILHQYHAHATFFVVGRHVPTYASLLRSMARDGDEIGNHTYSHLDLLWLDDAAIRAQLDLTDRLIQGAAGVTPLWFRPPYGAVDERLVRDASGLGLHTVLWSVDPTDWALPGSTAITVRVLSYVHPGSIVILHDGGGNREETVLALPAILRALQARHYRFITLDEMFFPAQVRAACGTAGCHVISPPGKVISP